MKTIAKVLFGAATLVALPHAAATEMEELSDILAPSADDLAQGSPPDPMSIQLPSVPAVALAGKDGLPELPSIDDMLKTSSQTYSGITSEAVKLKEELKLVQRSNKARVLKQKAVFDAKLKEQEKQSQAVIAENTRIAKEIMSMKSANAALLAKAGAMMKENDNRREMLKIVQTKISQAASFLRASKEVVHVKEPKITSLLQMPISRHLRASTAPSADSQIEELSFMQMEMEALTPEIDDTVSLVRQLSSGLSGLKSKGKVSEAKVKNMFLSSFKAGVKRRQALLDQQKVLKGTHDAMATYKSRLDGAISQLETTKKALDTSSKKLGAFLGTLAKEATAPNEGVKAAYENLSKHDYSGLEAKKQVAQAD